MRQAAIDNLVFQAAPLGESPSAWPPALSVHVTAGTMHKGFTQPLPFVARRAPILANDPAWPAYCGLLRELGIPLQSAASALDSLPVAKVPMRFARRGYDEGFDAVELETAEAIEISCSRSTSTGRAAHMPLEISAWHELKSLIDTLRELSNSQTPIGLGMVAGDVSADTANALAARADFIVLETPGISTAEPTAAELDLLVWGIAAARGACMQAGAPNFPIFVDAALTQPDDLIKLLALGASAVSIDALALACLPPTLPVTAPAAKGMLSGIGALPTKASPALNVAMFEKKLTELIDQLKSRLHQQHLGHVRDLAPAQLRALNEPAARLAAVRLLAH